MGYDSNGRWIGDDEGENAQTAGDTTDVESGDGTGREAADSSDSTMFGEGWVEAPAPTTTPSFPRAVMIGWHSVAELLVIVFRRPGSKKKGFTGPAPWIYYEGVDREMWEELLNYHSTGEWLVYSGVENNNYYEVPGFNKAGLEAVTKRYTDVG